MALTYDQHKAAIDTAYPTPPVDWARQDDHVTFAHHEVAVVELAFNELDYHYLGSHYRENGAEVWKIRRILVGGGREGAGGVQVSWDDAKAAFETYWEDHCEAQRAILAASAYGKDVVDDVPGDTPTVRLSFLHIGGTGTADHPPQPWPIGRTIRVRCHHVPGDGYYDRDRADWGIGEVALRACDNHWADANR